MSGNAWLVGLVVGAVACGPPPRNGAGDDDVVAPDASAPGGDGSGNGCAQGAESVYVIDHLLEHLFRFDPPTKSFTDLGQPFCPTSGKPFSMGVDRDAVAWVLYDTGELFEVQLNNALACTKTTWASANGLHQFGMGFTTDTVGGTTDSLYVGGGTNQLATSFTLAKLDTTTMTATAIGTTHQLPEMTGNANAELWGFMPDAATPHVVKFDKTNGAFLVDFAEPSLAGANAGYAFAHWGGNYWVFLMKNSEPSTTVYEIDGTTGAIVDTIPTIRTIVGAGVSTCAPTVLL